jgi:hypothetical protein
MICCLVAALIPNYSHNKSDDFERISIRLGLPFSPWLDFTSEHGQVEGGTRQASNAGIEFISVSFLLLVLAGAAEWAERKLRPKMVG